MKNMPDWMGHAFDDTVAVPWTDVSIRLATALILSLVVIGIYKATRRAVSATVSFPATLVLLCILIAMVTQVIGDNAARAFSLVGALSVVRFRTVVRDTKDTAFVIFAVVVGMATGYGQSGVAILGLIFVGIAAFLFRDRLATVLTYREMRLVVKLVWSQELDALLLTNLVKYADDVENVSAETIRQGAGMEVAYKLRLKSTAKPTQLVAEISRLPGIQSVEIIKDKEREREEI